MSPGYLSRIEMRMKKLCHENGLNLEAIHTHKTHKSAGQKHHFVIWFCMNACLNTQASITVFSTV